VIVDSGCTLVNYHAIEILSSKSNCVVSENIPTSPTQGNFSKSPPPHPFGNSDGASYISLHFLVYRTPHPPGNSNPFCGGSMDIFWN